MRHCYTLGEPKGSCDTGPCPRAPLFPSGVNVLNLVIRLEEVENAQVSNYSRRYFSAKWGECVRVRQEIDLEMSALGRALAHLDRSTETSCGSWERCRGLR
ncbi:hypothetical protein KC323_g168 [Hortaea werneckii]|nr:hypothetical protein KC323_g168 [Hortaea werneckii]